MKAIGEPAWTSLVASAEKISPEMLRALSPITVLAPHADDETLGCGALLFAAAAAGALPTVIYLTDGAGSHTNSPTWPRERLVQKRRAEASAALAILGVHRDRIFFMDWPDAAPFKAGSSNYENSVSSLLTHFQTLSPKSLWAPWSEEAHCDHQAANGVADDLARRYPALRRFDYLVWGWTTIDPERVTKTNQVWGLDGAVSVPARRQALQQHETQMTSLIADAKNCFNIPADLAALCDRQVEVYLERLPQ